MNTKKVNWIHRVFLTLLVVSLLATACSPAGDPKEKRILTIELVLPQTELSQGHSFELQLKLHNPGQYNVHVSRITLPKEVVGMGSYLGSIPPLTMNLNEQGEGLVDMDLTIAPMGMEVFTFRFEAAQTGTFTSQGHVITDTKDYPFDIQLSVGGVNPEGWEPGISPQLTPTALGSIPWQAVVQIEAIVNVDGHKRTGWTGSGTIISADGLILTNAHVVLSDRFYRVEDLIVSLTVADDAPPVRSYYASIVQADDNLDIAVIKPYQDINGNDLDYSLLNLPFVPLGDSDDLALGESLVILGYPGIGGETITLTKGEVSGFTAENPYGNRAYIKTSATIAGGNSGGLAVNERGELIGVPTAVGTGDLDDDVVDCRALMDTNRDGYIDDKDTCVPTGGFINALRPVNLALGLVQAAQHGQVGIEAGTIAEESFNAEGQVIFEDGFENPESGWARTSNEYGITDYEAGEYTLLVNSPMHYVFSDQEFNYDRVVIEADARVVQAVGDGDFGFICGRRENGDQYILEISEDGYYSIWKQINGEVVYLVDWTYSQNVVASGPMRLSAQCGSDQLILALNGKILASVSDAEFVPGGVGMVVGTFEVPGVKISFDNLRIILP